MNFVLFVTESLQFLILSMLDRNLDDDLHASESGEALIIDPNWIKVQIDQSTQHFHRVYH